MAEPSIDYFRIDDSAQGTVKVNGPPASTTDPTLVTVYDIQCYVAVRLGKGTTFSTIITDVGPFVKCVHRVCILSLFASIWLISTLILMPTVEHLCALRQTRRLQGAHWRCGLCDSSRYIPERLGRRQR